MRKYLFLILLTLLTLPYTYASCYVMTGPGQSNVTAYDCADWPVHPGCDMITCSRGDYEYAIVPYSAYSDRNPAWKDPKYQTIIAKYTISHPDGYAYWEDKHLILDNLTGAYADFEKNKITVYLQDPTDIMFNHQTNESCDTWQIYKDGEVCAACTAYHMPCDKAAQQGFMIPDIGVYEFKPVKSSGGSTYLEDLPQDEIKATAQKTKNAAEIVGISSIAGLMGWLLWRLIFR